MATETRKLVTVTIDGQSVSIPAGEHNFRELATLLGYQKATSFLVTQPTALPAHLAGVKSVVTDNQHYSVLGGESFTHSN